MYQDIREFIDDVERVGELRKVEGADPELQIGAVTEVAAESPLCPLVLFDRIKGYPPGYRIVTNLLHTPKRLARVVGLSTDIRGVAFVKEWKEKIQHLGYVPPTEVKDGPITENVISDKDVDILKFPVPRWHELDPGKYFGTGAITVTRDPDSGWVDCGVFRIQVHDNSTLGIFISTGRHLSVIARKYWSKRESCPVVVCTGTDPSFFVAASYPGVPFGVSEYEAAGWLRGESVPVIRGELTGLPIPATAEIALEGEIPPPEVESRLEGPFGEATGYYASIPMKRPIIRVKRIMHRNDPILHGAPPMKPFPGMYHFAVNWRAAAIWSELERADINGVTGVWQHGTSLTVIAMKQLHPGESKRAALVAAGSRNLDLSRFIVVVDEDIDPSNLLEVVWAMSTRCEPAETINIVTGRTIDDIDPRVPKEERLQGNITMSQALIDACRPYHWRDTFPAVNEVSAELKAEALKIWGNVLS
ncbi:UbiD family decarboxylase [Chloroflexota bacterium]